MLKNNLKRNKKTSALIWCNINFSLTNRSRLLFFVHALLGMSDIANQREKKNVKFSNIPLQA
jgi:hypothetical protein